VYLQRLIELSTIKRGSTGRPLTQASGGHRKRRFCDASCWQRSHRARQAEDTKAKQEESLREIQEQVAAALQKLEEEKQVLLSECARQEDANRKLEVQIDQLLAENTRLRQHLDVETRYRPVGSFLTIGYNKLLSHGL
jgi:septal ring factor EnvC (AmiA/AmiB activator)